MQDHWIGLSVDLKSLSQQLEQFFESRGFLVRREESSREFRIIVAPKRGSDLRDSLNVFIFGGPDDFSIKFVAGSNSRLVKVVGPLAALLGGGLFILNSLKSVEEVEKLEEEFWEFVDNRIDILARKKAGRYF